MVAVNRQSKMLAFINARVRVTIVDGRHIVGRFLAFDRHMNLVLADAEEFRRLRKKKKPEKPAAAISSTNAAALGTATHATRPFTFGGAGLPAAARRANQSFPRHTDSAVFQTDSVFLT